MAMAEAHPYVARGRLPMRLLAGLLLRLGLVRPGTTRFHRMFRRSDTEFDRPEGGPGGSGGAARG